MARKVYITEFPVRADFKVYLVQDEGAQENEHILHDCVLTRWPLLADITIYITEWRNLADILITRGNLPR